jgi:anti-anti-sigma factor
MATQITQIDYPERNQTVLRVEGDMLCDDARVIEKIANCVATDNGHRITIDLADLDYMDSEAASVLRQMQLKHGLEIEGIEIFLQSAVDMAERS